MSIDYFMEGHEDRRAIDQVSELYAAYIKGWDAALLRAAFSLDGPARDEVLSLVKTQQEMT